MSHDFEAIDSEALLSSPVTVHPQDTLREAAHRLAERSLSRVPVVERGKPDRLLGVIEVQHLLQARLRDMHEEHRRERVLQTRPGPIRETSAWEGSA